MLEYLQSIKNYCIFVHIFTISLQELTPFIISFIGFIAFFTLIIILMQGSSKVDDDSDYIGIVYFF
jgi:hypothetical protein